MSKAQANVHGAISIVNAIATGKGATLGISLRTNATVETSQGNGVFISSENQTISSRLINKVIEKIVPKKDLAKTRIDVLVESEIPTGYGLKSSSAISSAVGLACAKIFKPKWSEKKILVAGVDASIEAKVSLTGAFDDACGCYYGGFAVTDNYARKIIKLENGPRDLKVLIFVPSDRKRGKIKELKSLKKVFEQAWDFAKKSDYWNAMILNGFATASVLNSDPKIISELFKKGALGASISGNGPSIAAVAKKDRLTHLKKILSSHEGRFIVSDISNKKAEIHEL